MAAISTVWLDVIVRIPVNLKNSRKYITKCAFKIKACLAYNSTGSKVLHCLINPLSPKIHIQILQTDLHTFLLRTVERIWFKMKTFSLW